MAPHHRFEVALQSESQAHDTARDPILDGRDSLRLVKLRLGLTLIAVAILPIAAVSPLVRAVAEEARATAEAWNCEVSLVADVGVAGVHRLLLQEERLRGARVIVVAAGMEGALASVVGGLTDKPVIAVPTSVGYGASFGGVAALLGMLNSCSPTVAVVNIDNGFGAGVLASVINRL